MTELQNDAGTDDVAGNAEETQSSTPPAETKTSSPKRKVGRPKGSKTKVKVKAKTKAKVKAKGKTKVGRPKGSKNKPRSKPKGKIVAKRTKASRSVNKFDKFSIKELQSVLDAKQKALTKFQAQRNELVSKIRDLDKSLAKAQGTKIRKLGRPKAKAVAKPENGRRKAGGTLMNTISGILRRRKNGMTVKDLTEAVKKAGYKSRSKNLYPMIAQALRNTAHFARIDRGVYKVS